MEHSELMTFPTVERLLVSESFSMLTLQENAAENSLYFNSRAGGKGITKIPPLTFAFPHYSVN